MRTWALKEVGTFAQDAFVGDSEGRDLCCSLLYPQHTDEFSKYPLYDYTAVTFAGRACAPDSGVFPEGRPLRYDPAAGLRGPLGSLLRGCRPCHHFQSALLECGDYFGILKEARVTTFPFNVLDNPMYWGSTANYLGWAVMHASPTGLLLTAVVALVYMVAILYEEPFTAQIYQQKASPSHKRR
ncbi:phosphatidylethanolamine N-methyltransferase isoform X11 [Ailuropoda melanoleuca]|uniref:phosphatidylethanolamine N-methyltransferase isoform X11 n=1 Tax=Ailuropoda melanoleuca TaxID=9646 RepID=UPI0014941A3B|nr:phosphatidylethanolamine N-methyltransferase isoform X11 [Ailuropoda melanoleuca]